MHMLCMEQWEVPKELKAIHRFMDAIQQCALRPVHACRMCCLTVWACWDVYAIPLASSDTLLHAGASHGRTPTTRRSMSLTAGTRSWRPWASSELAAAQWRALVAAGGLRMLLCHNLETFELPAKTSVHVCTCCF